MSTTTNASPFAIAPIAERPLQRGLAFGGALRWPALTASVLLIATVGATLAQPVLVSWVIDRGVVQKDMEALSLSILLLLLAVAAEALLTAGHLLLFAWVGERYLARLRIRVFEHLCQLSLRFYDAHNTGALIARASDDVQTLSSFVRRGMSSLLTGVLLLGLGIVVMGSLSPPLLAVSLICVPMLRWLSRRYIRRAEPAQRRNRERYEARMQVVSVNNRYFPWLEFTWVFVAAAIIGAGAGLNSVGMVTVGVVSAFVLSLTRIFGPLESLGRLFGEAQSAKASLGRIFALLDVPLEIRERPGAAALSAVGTLEVDGVSFAYLPETPVVTEISLSVQPGETLALVGPTGAGKSTLARLLARLYDPEQGTVSYGGLDLRDATLASVRRRIVLLPQEGHLFRGTVAENISLFRPDTSEKEIAEVVADLGLEERFGQFPEGLLTHVDARGARLSSGERQLISLARVALVNPEVAILDEALSNVDPGTEALVERAMRRLMEGRTVIVIAHRETTAERADRVAFLDGGALVAQGRHEALLRASSAYARLWGQVHDGS